MPGPYGDDRRLKALACVDRGVPKSQVSRLFNLSRNTRDLWLKRRAQTGSVSATRVYPRGPQPKIADRGAFRAFAEAHGPLTQRPMATPWRQQGGETVSDRTIGKALKRIGFTGKKRLAATANATTFNAQHSSSN